MLIEKGHEGLVFGGLNPSLLIELFEAVSCIYTGFCPMLCTGCRVSSLSRVVPLIKCARVC